MSRNCYLLCLLILALAILPAIAHAFDVGAARLVSVTAVDGGCVSGPTGSTVQAWDVEPGHTYTIRITSVTECANGGTDAALDVRVNSSTPGYEYSDLVAVYISPGIYEFNFTLPEDAWCTFPILYCTTPGGWLTSGIFVGRNDGLQNRIGRYFQAHLRASSWPWGCGGTPTPILGPECGAIGTEESSWGVIKSLYN